MSLMCVWKSGEGVAERQLASCGTLAHAEPKNRSPGRHGHGHEEITHKDRGIQEMAAWIREQGGLKWTRALEEAGAQQGLHAWGLNTVKAG